MSRVFYRAGAALLTVLAINGCSDASAPVAPVTPPMTSLFPAATTYSGRAFALQVRVPSLGINQRVSDTGPLPSGGGNLSNAVVAFSIPNVLQLEILSASTSGQGTVATSQAKVNRTKVFVGPNVILVEVLQAFSKAECVIGQPVVSGSLVILGIKINNQSTIVTGQPNQVVPLPGGGTLTINEQIVTSNSIIVRGVHIRQDGVMDVIVSHAKSDINC